MLSAVVSAMGIMGYLIGYNEASVLVGLYEVSDVRQRLLVHREGKMDTTTSMDFEVGSMTNT